MRITAVRLRQLSGTLPTPDGPLWEDRLVRPLDVYDEYRHRSDFEGGVQTPGGFALSAIFLEIDTDDGVLGRAGPLTEPVAFHVAHQLRPLLLGRDPIAGEKLWDQRPRALVHGRQGAAMMAISAVDCALWDLRGRSLDQPVHRLLGGPTRDAVPAYASMLGFAVQDPVRVRDRAREYRERGFVAQKWFFRHGPLSGAEGMRANVALVRAAREAVGDDYPLMFDCWGAMDVPYVVELAERIAPYRPHWLEECAMFDRIDSLRRIRDKVAIPLAGAEHEYTRWGFRRFVDAGALDVLQPDAYWCGGLSELLKIAALATAHDLRVIPHGDSSAATLQFSLAQSPIHTPWQEHLVIWNRIRHHFLRHPAEPVRGLLHPPAQPGMAMELAAERIEREHELFP